jgi:hypothetical protein
MTIMTLENAEPAERYFTDVAQRVFDDYFTNLGARRSQDTRHNVVRYVADLWFAEVVYLPKDGPNYCPRVMIGCREEPYVDPRRNRVDVMHTVPEDAKERSYNMTWSYRNASELERSLEFVRDKIVEIYAKAYLFEGQRLRSLLAERHKVIEDTWKNEIDEHNAAVSRAKAKKAFDAKDYATAIELYGEIPLEKQTETERARVRYAKARVR